MEKSDYKEMAYKLKILESAVRDKYTDGYLNSKLSAACSELIEHCDRESRPNVISLIKAVRNEMPWVGLKEAKDAVQKMIADFGY